MPATVVKRVEATANLKEQVVSINRVTKVVKGGKNLSFSALVVVGDPQAKIVGFGTGKAKEVPAAIKKGIEAAKKNLHRINVLETTIAHAANSATSLEDTSVFSRLFFLYCSTVRLYALAREASTSSVHKAVS